MGLYEAIDALPPGHSLHFLGVDGTTVVYEPYTKIPGRLDVAIRTRGVDSAGNAIRQDESIEGVDRAWCEQQEEELRALGIDPDASSVI